MIKVIGIKSGTYTTYKSEDWQSPFKRLTVSYIIVITRIILPTVSVNIFCTSDPLLTYGWQLTTDRETDCESDKARIASLLEHLLTIMTIFIL